jgi:phospholipase C
MMQGHSYDNYLGTADRGDGFTLDAGGQPVNSNWLPNGRSIRAHRLSSTLQSSDAPIDSLRASRMQFDGGTNNGFVQSIEVSVPGADAGVAMGYWTKDDLPFYHALAQTFPVADRWFASFLGPALPNRRFLVAGTSNGLIDELPFGNSDYPAAGTIFDSLAKHSISWVNYQGTVRKPSVLLPRVFARPGLIAGRRILRGLSAINPFPMTSLRGRTNFTADVYPIGLSQVRHVRELSRFFADTGTGALPSVSIVDPDFEAFSGRNPQDVSVAEEFVAAVVNAVMRGPGWPGTLLIWLHDNGGGYYDHVPPPAAVPPDDIPGRSLFDRARFALLLPFVRQVRVANAGPRTFDRLGFRVPAVVVSPYARTNFVSSTVYDHTSVLALIERKWNLPPLTRRDAAAEPPLDMLDFDGPPAFLLPPALPDPSIDPFRPRPSRNDAATAFTIGSTRDLSLRLFNVMAAWGVGFLAFGGADFWFQSVTLAALALLTVRGVRASGFWRQWVFWRPREQPRLVAIYNSAFALITLSAFCALISSELYLYGPFHIAGHRPVGNILGLYTATYFWNLIDAIPALEITGTLHWDSPLQVSGVWGELFLLMFRLLVLSPALGVIVQAARGDKPEGKNRAPEKPDAG